MGHTFGRILLHVIFSTKGRLRTIDNVFRDRLYRYIVGIARREIGEALCIGGTDDHLHSLLSIGTDISGGEAVKKMKSLSSGFIHKTYPSSQEFRWQSGYGVFSVSQSQADAVIQYINTQQEHHRKQTFQQEYVAFLKRHNVPFDPERVWE